MGIIDIGFEGFSGLMGTELPVGFQARCYTDLGVSSDELADCEIDGVHGNASTETVIDVAPDVSLYLTNPQSHADMRDAVNWMISEDVSVINASISWWFDGPGDGTSPYSTGLVNTVERAVEDDIVWVTSAGNSARHTWFGTFSDPDSNGLLNFQGFEERNFLRIGDGTSLLDYPFAVDLRWEDNWVLEDGTLGGAASNLDVFVVDGATNKIVASGRDPQSGGPGHIPQELFGLESFNEPPTGSSYYIFVSLVEGEPPDWVQMTLNHAGPELQLYTLQGSIKNPAEGKNPGMLAVGAAHWDDVHAIEPYSSRGPTPDGRVKPDIVGAACGATSQYPLSEYNSGYCGTSQASPHVAGLATLVRQRFPSYTPAQVASYLKDNAEQRQSPDPNSTWGHGFIKLPPPDGTTTPVPTPSNAFTRNPAADFNTLAGASNFRPGGIWSDGETMWVSDPFVDKIYAYDMATKGRVSGKDFDTLQAAGNTGPYGTWSDGETMWVADLSVDKIYAYDMATKGRVSGKDFDTLQAAGNTGPLGIWSDGETMWVSDWEDTKIYAYDMANKERVPDKDFDTLQAARNVSPRGVWSDGMTMWVADARRAKVYAYDMATKARVPGREFNSLDAAGNWFPVGIWSDGTTMWVSDWEDAKIYAYRMRKAVVFGNPNWTSALLQTEIARHMVEHGYGYATEKVPGASIPLLQNLRDGDIHLLMEVWLPNQTEQWEAALSAGDILDLGTSLGNDWQSAFVIPAYLQEQYPGLDHVEDLKQQQYRSLFSTAETGGKAPLVSCVVSWPCELR